MDAKSRPMTLNLPSRIEIGEYELDTWYSAPYPEEYVKDDKKLLICEFCLSYMLDHECLAKHNMKCSHFCPPGNEIYRSLHRVRDHEKEQSLSVYEVDGAKEVLYCRNLCFLGKMFIDHKTLCYDVENFLLYVLTFNDDIGSHIIGYFSKEKHSHKKYNVSCIMILPQYQGYGYGKFLIEFSYLLTKCEKQYGTPERPLSEFGLKSYMNYWKYSIIDAIKDKESISIKEISDATSMTIDDVIYTLESTNLIRTKQTVKADKNQYRIYLQDQDLDKLSKSKLNVKPEDLRWASYVSLYAKTEIEDQDELDTATNQHSAPADTNTRNSGHNLEQNGIHRSDENEDDRMSINSFSSDATEILSKSPQEHLPKLEPINSCVDGY